MTTKFRTHSLMGGALFFMTVSSSFAHAVVDLDFNTLTCVADDSNPSEIRMVKASNAEQKIFVKLKKRSGAEIDREYDVSKEIYGETRVSIFGGTPHSGGHWVQITYDPKGQYKAIIVTELEDGRLPCVIE